MVSCANRLPRKCVLDSNICETPFWPPGSNSDDAAAGARSDWNRGDADQWMAFGPNRRGPETFGSAAARGGHCLCVHGNGESESAGRDFALTCHNRSCVRVSARFLVHANENVERNYGSGNLWFDQLG